MNKVTWQELLPFAKHDSYYIANRFGEFDEFEGMTAVSKELLCRMHACIINRMSDGELVASAVQRRIAGLVHSFACEAMVYAAEKRGLGSDE